MRKYRFKPKTYFVKGEKYDLQDSLVEFDANSALLCKDLPNDMIGVYYANQLLRSGVSSALNFGEAQGTN